MQSIPISRLLYFSSLAMTGREHHEQHLSCAQTKRRKLRKGTHSCWECKRRKMRCIFSPLDTSTCSGCRRRGSQCVSQEFPESLVVSLPIAQAQSQSHCAMADNVATPTSPGGDGARGAALTGLGIPTPASMASSLTSGAEASPLPLHRQPSLHNCSIKNSSNHSFRAVPLPTMNGHDHELSGVLYASLPPRENIDRICAGSRRSSVLAHDIMTTPLPVLEQLGLATAETLLEFPDANAHPVLIARHMLLLAMFLQSQNIKDLTESDQTIMEQMVDLVTSRVTQNDRFLGSIEGLECLMMESTYHANIGNLRRSWLAIRRAMSVAQLMGLNRARDQTQYEVLGARTHYDPCIVWFRIVDFDRYLCLMLGLPQGCLDRSMASSAALANDTLLGRMERVHCMIASRILERNESPPSSRDPTLTRNLDVELQKAARQLPSKWWLVPDLHLSPNPQALFWDTRRLFAQVLHYNLLNQLHLPYMLRSSSNTANAKHEYSLITCVNASREMLSRFIALRSFNGVAYSCRTIDFIALMAAMTLLLAHLDSHRSETENLLAHQYHSDRAMIEQVKDSMEELNRVSSDALSAQIADWLARLLAIEAEAADDDQPRCARAVIVQDAGVKTADADGAIIVQLPYFGVLKIARDGMSREVYMQQHKVQGDRDNTAVHVEATTALGSASRRIGTPLTAGSNCGSREHPTILETLSPSAPVSNDVSSLDQGLVHYPEVAAGGEQSAFQGVDWAFFGNLTRHSWIDACDPVDADWTMT